MPKMKTHSASKKRFKKIGSGSELKVKKSGAYKRHLLTKKSAKRKRNLRGASYIDSADIGHLRKLLPN